MQEKPADGVVTTEEAAPYTEFCSLPNMDMFSLWLSTVATPVRTTERRKNPRRTSEWEASLQTVCVIVSADI